MKILFISAALASSPVVAQTIECPRHFPAEAVPLPDRGASRGDSASLFPSRLSSAVIQVGELHGSPVDVPPPARRVKDGWDTEYRFTSADTTWLVCRYGGDGTGFAGGAITESVEWWKKVVQGATFCLLRAREDRQPHSAGSWTAMAMCR